MSAPGRARSARRVVTVATIALLLAPVLRDRDSFPLSTYPMYASASADRVDVATVVGYDDGGARRTLSLGAIARTDDPLVAESAVAAAIHDGRSDELCAAVARRVSPGIHRLEVVTEWHDLDRWSDDEPSLVSWQVHSTCEASP